MPSDRPKRRDGTGPNKCAYKPGLLSRIFHEENLKVKVIRQLLFVVGVALVERSENASEEMGAA
jgi:hypothetical protein